MKLIKKTRIGAKVTKQYDTAKTPLQRLLSLNAISREKRDHLLSEFRSQDPLALLAKMARLQARLWQETVTKVDQSAPETPDKEMKSAQDETQRLYSKCPASFSTNDAATPQYSIPKRAMRREKKGTGLAPAGKEVNTRIDVTEEFIDSAVRRSSGQQIIYRDKKLIGFGLRVNRLSKSFIVEARVNGKCRRMTIGGVDSFSVEEARREAVWLLRQMKRGVETITLRNQQDESLLSPQYSNWSVEDSTTEKATQQSSTDRMAVGRYAHTRIDVTQALVDSAVHRSSGQPIIYRDKKLIGFGFRVCSRVKSFIVEARVNGKARRITIGRADLLSVEEARQIAARLLHQMRSGAEPLTLRKKRKQSSPSQ